MVHELDESDESHKQTHGATIFLPPGFISRCEKRKGGVHGIGPPDSTLRMTEVRSAGHSVSLTRVHHLISGRLTVGPIPLNGFDQPLTEGGSGMPSQLILSPGYIKHPSALTVRT